MKTIIKLTLLILALLLPVVVSAHDFEVNGIYYNKNGSKATVTYRGSSSSDYSDRYVGNVTIPSSVTYNGTTYSVTSIGSEAFYKCYGLSNVTIPNSVTSIGYSAFSYCTGLTDITIPNSVTSIGYSTFSNCTGLTDITIPNSLTSIGTDAFYYCTGLTSITIPNSVTSIGSYAFYYCTGLTNITIPKSVTSIGSDAFSYCTSLTRVYISDLTAWCQISFSDASGNPLSFAQHLFLNGQEIQHLVIPNTITSISRYAFYGFKSLTNLTIPNTITSIGEYAFSNCTNLANVTIPNSVTSIGKNAFSGCKLTDTYCNIGNPTSVVMGPNVFYLSSNSDYSYSNRKLHVPAGSLAAYQNSSNWQPYFGSIVETTILPTNASNKVVTWTSSNSSIASVNSNGLVNANATGYATITATTTDGSNLRATCVVTVYNNDHSLQTGEWAFLDDGSPAMVGQSTSDHFFVRMDYADNGVLKTYDNVVSFKAGTPQTVWFWLDDDEVYQNEKINALTPIAYDNAGNLYNEITYSSFQCDVYLPQGFRIVSTENEDGDELKYAQGDRLPNGVIFEIGTRDELVVDGITYTPYSIVCSNTSAYGSHFSAKNANRYKNNGALKKDDAPLFGLFIQNDNQDEIEGRLADIIIANQEFGVREANIAGWAPNDYRFIYGTGGNNESQRFQLYNRVALYGSSGIDNNIVFANGIYLNISYKSLNVNDSFQLTATVTPDNATNKAVTWKSSNVNVATVDNNGNVRAISPGTATITATTADGSNLSASCYVTVNAGNVLATSISLNTNSLVLGINESSQLVATVYPSNTTNKTVNWYSSNTSVATVNSDGLVTAIAEGNATIIATTTDGTNLYASCMVSVNILATSISLSANYLTLDVNQTSQLTATIYPTNTTNKTVTWSSSNTAVATVNTDGVVTTISPGIATITATTTDGSNLSATCNVTVVRLVRSISLNENSLSLTVDQTAQLSATVYPSNATNKSVTWKSSNTNVATVSNNGLVIAKASGTATITATTTDGSNLSASCAVTVSSVPVTSISLNSVSVILDLSNTYTYQLVPTIIPSNATNKTVTWKSSNSAVATVSSTGLVTAKAPGSATITATTTDGTNLNASCQVTVIKRVTGITLNNSSLTLTLPETARLVATITPNDATTQTLNWTSSNTSVATVDANGLITTKAIGTTTIKASTTDGSNLSASCLVTVKKQYINSITLNVETLVMHIGDTFQLIADVQPENASNTTLNWSTGNSSVASVDNNGLVTAVAGGTTYIIASATDGSNTYANCTIEVLPDYYLTLDTLSHIRGSLAQIQDLPVSLINKNPISGIQFDVKLPNGVDFNYVDDLPDVWLDENRATRTHSISANKLSNGNYRVLVTSSASKDLRGNDGVLVHMNMLLPQIHNTGNSYINISNIIASESDETRHTLNNTSTAVRFYYIVGDADANAVVDIADHASTASKILGYSPTPFYNDAANVDGNNSLDVVDLVGITNIALEIRPISIRQAPRRGNVENRLFCDKLHIYSGGEKEISIGIDCNFDFAGFQMDMKLPHGLTLMGATLGDEASKLGLDTQTMPDGTIRILGTSFSDASVNGVCPQLLTLRVRADRNYHSDSQIEFSDILFAERDLTAHCFDSSFIEYVEPSTIYELMDEARIYVENGNIIVDTPIAGTVQLIAIDGRMIEYQAHVGHNVYPIDVSGVYIIHFLNKTIKVLL